MAQVLGLYGSAFNIWAEKTGRLAEGEASQAMRLGSKLEPIILDLAEAELGPLRRDVMTVAHPLAANTDGVIIATGEPVEAKTSGIQGPIYGEWGEPGTDEVPESYIVQCHVHMICLAKEVCHLPALLGGRGYVRYIIERNKEVAEIIEQRAADFWRLVELDIPPEDSTPTVEISRLVKRIPKKIIEIPADDLIGIKAARETRLAAEKIEDEAKRKIMARLDAEQAEAGNVPGLGAVTYFTESRKSYTVREWSGPVFRICKKSF